MICNNIAVYTNDCAVFDIYKYNSIEYKIGLKIDNSIYL